MFFVIRKCTRNEHEHDTYIQFNEDTRRWIGKLNASHVLRRKHACIRRIIAMIHSLARTERNTARHTRVVVYPAYVNVLCTVYSEVFLLHCAASTYPAVK